MHTENMVCEEAIRFTVLIPLQKWKAYDVHSHEHKEQVQGNSTLCYVQFLNKNIFVEHCYTLSELLKVILILELIYMLEECTVIFICMKVKCIQDYKTLSNFNIHCHSWINL